MANNTNPPNDSGKHGKTFNRRRFLSTVAGGGAALGTGTLLGTSMSASAAEEATAADGGSLTIPDLLSGEKTGGALVYDLTMQTGTHELLSGVTSKTAGYNGSFLGPTLRMAKADQVKINVTNSLGVETTTHWHGLHIPPSMDGGPQNTIADGDTWSPTWEVLQDAMTCWLSYRRAAEIFEAATRPLANPLSGGKDIDTLDGWSLHQLRRRDASPKTGRTAGSARAGRSARHRTVAAVDHEVGAVDE